jgi:hypothetical protein
MKQQEKPRGVGEAVNHQEIRLPLATTSSQGQAAQRALGGVSLPARPASNCDTF